MMPCCGDACKPFYLVISLSCSGPHPQFTLSEPQVLSSAQLLSECIGANAGTSSASKQP